MNFKDEQHLLKLGKTITNYWPIGYDKQKKINQDALKEAYKLGYARANVNTVKIMGEIV